MVSSFASLLAWVLAGTGMALLVPDSVAAEVGSGADPATLREVASGLFEIGVGVSVGTLSDPAAMALIRREFDCVTPENCMKPDAIQREPGVGMFRDADRFATLASRNGLRVVGHCLMWAKDDRTPAWFFEAGDGAPAGAVGPQDLIDRLRMHVGTVAGRYGNHAHQWDVVNEALADSGGVWRASRWQEISGGPGFLVEAFKAARAADPDALLIYNDYRCELPGKRESLFTLIEYLQTQGAPLDAVGLQGHYELDSVPFDELETTLIRIRQYGLKAVISELDIDVVTRSRWWAEDGRFREELAASDPFAGECPPDVLQRQAEQYARLFAIFARNADVIERVTFWNLHDGQSWLNEFPWKRTNHPLLFDRDLRPKPAHRAVVEALREAHTGAPPKAAR